MCHKTFFAIQKWSLKWHTVGLEKVLLCDIQMAHCLLYVFYVQAEPSVCISLSAPVSVVFECGVCLVFGLYSSFCLVRMMKVDNKLTVHRRYRTSTCGCNHSPEDDQPSSSQQD